MIHDCDLGRFEAFAGPSLLGSYNDVGAGGYEAAEFDAWMDRMLAGGATRFVGHCACGQESNEYVVNLVTAAN